MQGGIFFSKLINVHARLFSTLELVRIRKEKSKEEKQMKEMTSEEGKKMERRDI